MSELTNAIKQICDEKGLAYEAVLGTIESALAAAYRKDFGKKNQNIVVEFNPDTTKSKIFDVKEVVEDLPEEPKEGEEEAKDEKGQEEKDKRKTEEIEEKINEKIAEAKHASPQKSGSKAKEAKGIDKKDEEKAEKEEKEEEEKEEEFRFNPKTMIQLTDAKLIKKTAKVGDEIRLKLDVPEGYGRMAAQTAKQVIIQRLREAERDMIFNDFKEKEGEVISGVVQRREGKIVLVDLGRAVGILPPDEIIHGEQYRTGDRIKVYVKEVNSRPRGPEIILSRTADEILKKVFYLEIPEISNGLIELKNVAREAGFRSKVAVWTDSDNVDPIGSCVGQRGARIQTIIAELGGEKVDIIQYDEKPISYITNALSPAKVVSIDIHEEEKKAIVRVLNDQLSLAIGKGGQNARLAAKLTGWKIDIVEEGGEKAKNKEAKEEREKEEEGEKAKESEEQQGKNKEEVKEEEVKEFKKGGEKDNKKKEKTN